MAISKKNKRRIVYNGRNFFWWVNPEFDGSESMLSVNVASEDKKFLIKYFVVRTNPQSACILVVGEYFPGLKGKTGNSMKISCPDFSHLLERKGVTPKMVEEILRWSFSESIEKTEQV